MEGSPSQPVQHNDAQGSDLCLQPVLVEKLQMHSYTTLKEVLILVEARRCMRAGLQLHEIPLTHALLQLWWHRTLQVAGQLHCWSASHQRTGPQTGPGQCFGWQ